MYCPLSQTQMGIYAGGINAEGEGKYNICSLYELDKTVDAEKLKNAIEKVVMAHHTLFSRLTTNDEGEVVFEERLEESFHVTEMTVGSLDEVRDRIGAEYDLMHDRLFRVEMYKTPSSTGESESIYLYADIHHIFSDGMTFSNFMQEIGEVYDGGEPRAETKTLFDLNLEEQAERGSEAYEEAKQWYRDNFAAAAGVDSLPHSDLPSTEAPAGENAKMDIIEFSPDIDYKALETFCDKTSVRESVFYTSAFAFLLSKFSGNSEVLFSTIYHGRPHKEDRNAYSMMVKTIPVYLDMETTPTVEGLLHSTGNQIIESRKRTCYSFAEVNADLGLKTNILFSYQGTLNGYDLVLDGKQQKEIPVRVYVPGLDLNVTLTKKPEGILVLFKYRKDRYSRAFAEDMTMSYGKILKEFLCRDNLSGISIISERQQETLDAFHNTATAEVPFKRFYEPIEHYASVTPDAAALIACDRTLTYRQFNEEANRVAHALISRGVKPSDRIVLLLPRTS